MSGGVRDDRRAATSLVSGRMSTKLSSTNIVLRAESPVTGIPDADTGLRTMIKRATHSIREVIRTPVYGTSPTAKTTAAVSARPATKVTAGFTGSDIARTDVISNSTIPATIWGSV